MTQSAKYFVPRGWEDYEFLFRVASKTGCGGTCTLSYDETGAPRFSDQCSGTQCGCMPLPQSLSDLPLDKSGVPWPCIGPSTTEMLLDESLRRYRAALTLVRTLRWIVGVLGLIVVILGGSLGYLLTRG